MLGKVYKGSFLIENMNNKIILTIFMALFLMSFVQAEIFGTPEKSCPAQVVCDTSEEVSYEEPTYFLVIIVSLFSGALIAILFKRYGKNLFRKKKKKTILDLDNDEHTDQMFEEASKDVEGNKRGINQVGTKFRW
ncbi:hypothetical protein LCGC14_1900630 [marine sediment metagenome]|uniref:Uncharacterized protein n=1 Tax=marine sediment metagenome TaxID=412755 RepID=A0A0F9IUT7_9ZZZZ